MIKTLLLLALAGAPVLAAKPELKRGDPVTVVLVDGKEIRGVFQERKDGAVWVALETGEMGVDADTIRALRREDNDVADFLKERDALPEDDANAHYELAMRAKKKGLNAAAQAEAERVLALVPDDKRARLVLDSLRAESQKPDGERGPYLVRKAPNKAAKRAIEASPTGKSLAASANPGALLEGEGVLLTMKQGQEISGIFKGRAGVKLVLDIAGGEMTIDPKFIVKIRRVSGLRVEYLSRKSALTDEDSAGHWRLSQWAKLQGMKAEAIEEAQAAANNPQGHRAAEMFLASPIFPNEHPPAPAASNDPLKRR